MTKLKIDLKNGYLEVEGEEKFVEGIYEDYKDVLSLVISRQPVEGNTQVIQAQNKEIASTTTPFRTAHSGVKSRSKNKESHKVVSNLNLKPQDKESFRDFVAKKQPGSGNIMNVVSVYYMSKVLGIEDISPDHVYTCYKDASQKVPTALLQSLRDSASKKGWIDTSDMARIRITTAGENYVEHDLVLKKGK